jgi:hypothetical protein
VDFFSYVLLGAAIFWLGVLVLHLAMSIYISMRRRGLDRRMRTLLARYELPEASSVRRPRYGASVRKPSAEEPPGDVTLELDLTSDK